ncbi:MAG TPA: hypothetical protein VFN35_05150 [Ktedonobacteraceae bacterium]|nr:hypothetical protein [Ktedonobacteraceae bacterium]
MQQTCPRCGGISDAASRFCTNCGNVMEAPQRYRQSWESPAQNSSQVPPWAQATGGTYQQQIGTNGQGGGFGFGGQNDATVRKLLIIVGVTLLSAFLLLIACIALAIVVPIPGVRSFFLIFALLLIIIAWIIYQQIRRIIRRTVGRIWWFL